MENNVAVFRFHDYYHKRKPDGILHSLLKKLDWVNYYKETERNTGICFIPETPLKHLAGFFKNKLDLKRPSLIGHPNMSVPRWGFCQVPGALVPQIGILRIDDAEVLVAEDVNEWETSEYVRDAPHAGMKKV